MENIRDHTTESDTPEIIIRLAGPEDAQAFSRLRYEFRAGQYPVTEAEADFLSRCGAWMAACLAPWSHWRCWVVEETGRLVGAIWLQIPATHYMGPTELNRAHAFFTALSIITRMSPLNGLTTVQ